MASNRQKFLEMIAKKKAGKPGAKGSKKYDKKRFAAMAAGRKGR
jgi:hypothetical protein